MKKGAEPPARRLGSYAHAHAAWGMGAGIRVRAVVASSPRPAAGKSTKLLAMRGTLMSLSLVNLAAGMAGLSCAWLAESRAGPLGLGELIQTPAQLRGISFGMIVVGFLLALFAARCRRRPATDC